MGFQSDLVVGVAQLLNDAGVGVWGTSYTTAQTGIYERKVPTADRCVVLSTFPVSDDPALSDSVIGLQVITRMGGADPRPTDDLDDAVYDVLHGLTGVTLSTGIRLVYCERRSGASLGQDALNRWSNTANYYLTVHRPSTHRT